MSGIVGIFVVGIITLGVYRLFELFVRKKERLSIIDKLGQSIPPEDVAKALQFPVTRKEDYSYSSWALRIALLLIGVGVGAIIAFFVQYLVIGDLLLQYHSEWEVRRNLQGFQEILYFSCIAMFGGAGLLCAYLVELKQRKANS